MSSIQIAETMTGQLEITTQRGQFTVEPLPASKGAPIASMVMGVSFGGRNLSVEEQERMYQLATGEENYQWIMDNLRLSEAQDVINAVVFWQVTGLDAAQAFLDGGVEKAMEVHLERMGLSLSKILLHLGVEAETPSPDGTNGTSTQKTSESASNSGKTDSPTANTDGKKS